MALGCPLEISTDVVQNVKVVDGTPAAPTSPMAQMPPIIASFIREFAEKNDLSELPVSKQFEHLLGQLLFRESIHGRFRTADVITGKGETGIDGACVVLDRNLILTEEDVRQYLSKRASSSAVVELVFFQGKTSQQFLREEILGFGDAILELLREDESVTPQDSYLNEIARIYRTLLQYAAKLDLTRASCRAYFCCLGEWKNASHPAAALQKLQERIQELNFFSSVQALPIDRNDVRRYWNDSTRSQEATLPTVARFPFPAMPGVNNAVVALVRAQDFVDKIIRDETGKVRIGIFDQNIRDFEGESNPVNQKIVSTITKPDTKRRFGIMNNGVTVVAKEMKSAADNYILRNYQIINGCQTSNVLERSREHLTPDILLQVRLIETTESNVLDDVVEATNSQTAVQQHQFAANRGLAVETQEFFRSYPVDPSYRLHFERRTSEFADASLKNTRIVTIPDLARSFGAIFLEEPHHVASAPNQAFSIFQERLFRDVDSPMMYYSSAFAYYRLSLLKVSGRLKIPHHRLYWHVLTAARRLSAGKLPSDQSRRKKDQHCEKFLAQLWDPSHALSLFEQAYRAIQDHTTQIDRDRLRRQAFTSEYLSKL